MLDTQRRTPPEEVVVILGVIRHIFSKPRDASSASDFTNLITELVSYFENSKKTAPKLAVIQTLERMVAKLDFAMPQSQLPSGDTKIWNYIMDIHKKARKWALSNDTAQASFILITRILANSPPDYFNQHFEAFIQSDLLAKKMKGYVYTCLLNLLQGRYLTDSFSNAKQSLYRKVEYGRALSSLMRPQHEFEPVSLLGRLELIGEIIFFSKAGAIEFDSLETCANIVVHLSSHK